MVQDRPLESLFDAAIELPPELDLRQATEQIPAGLGVCLLTDDENRPILLIYGGSVRDMIRRRLDEQTPQKKSGLVKLRPIARRIWRRRCGSVFEAQWRYFEIARQIYPDRYREFFPPLEMWLLSANLTVEYPTFSVTNQLGQSPTRFWGPFGTKKAATTCLEVLEDLFQLCRRPGRLAAAPRALPCSYAQIGRCVPVCDGSVSGQDYLGLIKQAVAFLDTPFATTASQLEQEMKALSQSLQFEQAGRVKFRLECVSRLTGPNCRWVGPLEQFFLLGFHPGLPIPQPEKIRPVKSIMPFVIHSGGVEPGLPIPLDDFLHRLPETIEFAQALRRRQTQPPNPAQRESVAWAVQFLYRNQKRNGLYFRVVDQLDVEPMAEAITAHFVSQKRHVADPASSDSEKWIDLSEQAISSPSDSHSQQQENES
jgi:hypothetical protein